MAPFSIDLPAGEKGAEGLPSAERLDDAIDGGLAAVLARLTEAGHAGRAQRYEDRAAAIGAAMTVLDRLVSGATPMLAHERGHALPRMLLRIMQQVLQANLHGGDAALQLAADSVKSIRDSWSLQRAPVDAG